MEKKSIAFRAKARTIDHLGKGQIADSPTAVSELWKNSYDAYARNVELHLFDYEFKCGAIIDNGCGMSYDQLIDSWLVIGTESKSKKQTLDEADRFGLPPRRVQGEKGIGRLSCAFLAPVTLLVTKKINTNFSVALIDWRLFENTYLSLSDIKVPVRQIDDLNELPSIFDSLATELKNNLRLSVDVDEDGNVSSDDMLIRRAWEKFSDDQIALAEQNRTADKLTTEQKIASFCEQFEFDSRLIKPWKNILERLDRSHGTALFLLELDRDLRLLTNHGNLSDDNSEVADIRKNLVDTLRAFVNPFLDHKSEENQDDFHYKIELQRDDGSQKTLINDYTAVFNYSDLLALEHVVEGEVDEHGWFRGSVKAFGIDKGEIRVPPTIEIDKSGTKVGPFKIRLGTFEYEADKSTHNDSEREILIETAKVHSGLLVFRDNLRVLPYGRADNDFFEIEEHRSKNASRYYFSSRRTFGQILISHEKNSALKDKAGREGFIRNQATRELKVIVHQLLVYLADTFFGRNASDRKKMLEIVSKERTERKNAQTAARKQSVKKFLEELNQQEPLLKEQLDEVRDIQNQILNQQTTDSEKLRDISERVFRLESNRLSLRIPLKPPRLGNHEQRYREYRDNYFEYHTHIITLKDEINKCLISTQTESPVQTARKSFERYQGLLNSQVNKSISKIETQLEAIKQRWSTAASEDRSEYHKTALDQVEAAQHNQDLNLTLNQLDVIYRELADRFIIKYDGILKALERINEGVDLSAAFSMAEEERVYFEDKAKSLQALAQLGISVEIMGHELADLDANVTTGLNSLPAEIKSNHPGFKLAYNSHKSLTQQIRFLSPLKLSGYQARKEIAGSDIKQHIETFFKDRFERQRVNFIFGDKFLRMRITDLPSRIFPVFVNIVNNALYWVSLAAERVIQIDVLENEVIIANSGPPIDEDDIERLFELFYSRRINGHGVGLYLCKENLAVAHHKIRYSSEGDKKLIEEGANFIISFNGMEIH